MWLNIIGFILCLLGGDMISKVIARIDDNDKEVILSCFIIFYNDWCYGNGVGAINGKRRVIKCC